MPRVVIFVALMSVRALATDEFADIREQNALLARQLADTQARLEDKQVRPEEKFIGMSDVGASVSDGTHSDSHPTDSTGTGGRRLQSPSSTASITYQGGALNFDSDIIVRGTINATGQISKEVVAFLVTATQDSSFSSSGDLQYVAFDSVEFNRGPGWRLRLFGHFCLQRCVASSSCLPCAHAPCVCMCFALYVSDRPKLRVFSSQRRSPECICSMDIIRRPLTGGAPRRVSPSTTTQHRGAATLLLEPIITSFHSK